MKQIANATIQRAEKDRDNPYKSIRRATIEDSRLSFEARGVLAYILVKPDDWKVLIGDLMKQGRIGRDKTYRILNELIAFGYIERVEHRDDRGRVTGYAYHVYEKPLGPNPLPEKPETVQPEAVQPETVQPETEKPHHTNKEKPTKDESSTKKEKEGEGESDPVIALSDPSTPDPAPAPPPASPISESVEDPPTPHYTNGQPAPDPVRLDDPTAQADKARASANGHVSVKKSKYPKKGPYLNGVQLKGDGYVPAGAGTNAVQVYHERFAFPEHKLSEPNEDDLIKKITDLDLWRQVVAVWDREGQRASHIEGMLDRYDRGDPDNSRRYQSQRNGNGKPLQAKGSNHAESRVPLTEQPDYNSWKFSYDDDEDDADIDIGA